MSNQVILWGILVIPWLTLLFMPKEDIKRYMPVALFGALLTTIYAEVALALKWWVIKDFIFPFYHISPMVYGGFLVGIIWIFKLTYKRGFILYMITNIFFEYLLSFVIDKRLADLGIMELVKATPLELMIRDLALAVALYGFQIWQEGIFARSERTNYNSSLQPAVAKPLPQKDKQEDDE